MIVNLSLAASIAMLSYNSLNSGVYFSQPEPKVEIYDYVEVAVNVDNPNIGNPFTEAAVEGKFQRENDQPAIVDGFCDSLDGSVFRVRFMPDATGKYSYSVTYRQGEFEVSSGGEFEAVESDRRGILRADPENPWHFIWEGTGEHYFWNGTTTYYLMGWQDDEIIQEIIDRLHSMKINRLRVLVYGRNKPHPWRMPVVPTEGFKLWLNPWVAERPDDIENPGFDLARFNVDFWQKYERMLRYAREKDVIISVIPFIGGQIYPTPFEEGSEDEWRYYRYAAARLAAFSNITWDLGNEHDFHREYPDWADKLGHRVKEWDPYDHLASAHNKTYRTPDSTWIDMQLIQRWDSGQNAFMLSQREEQIKTGRIIPQINEEYGYQDLWEKYPGHREAETRRRCAWEIYMAGCYQTAGETAEAGTGIPPDTGGGWVNGRGDDTMIMLKSYEHIVNFFTGLEWWRLEPHNEMTETPAMCLADPGNTYVIYMNYPDNATVYLEPGNYRVKWFNPRTGEWIDTLQAKSPIWTSPEPPDDGDWVILLEKDANIADQTPPSISRANASGDGKRLFVTFSELVDTDTATDVSNYSIDNGVSIKSASISKDGNMVILETSELVGGADYILTVNNVRDLADPPNTIEADSHRPFSFHSVLDPVVDLKFNEGSGRATANTGTSSKSHPTAQLTQKDYPSWTDNMPLADGGSALDFGIEAGEQAVDLAGGSISELIGARSFTIAGWVNCRDATVGSGGNRIVSWINNGGDGVDLVFLKDGRLQVSVNEWPDRSPAMSSAGRIAVDPNVGMENWRFFAVTYNSLLDSGNAKFYFGDSSKEATLDGIVDYNQGSVGYNSSSTLTVGNFNPATRSRRNSDRVFRGLIDEIRVYACKNDGTGALTPNQIMQIHKGKKL